MFAPLCLQLSVVKSAGRRFGGSGGSVFIIQSVIARGLARGQGFSSSSFLAYSLSGRLAFSLSLSCLLTVRLVVRWRSRVECGLYLGLGTVLRVRAEWVLPPAPTTEDVLSKRSLSMPRTVRTLSFRAPATTRGVSSFQACSRVSFFTSMRLSAPQRLVSLHTKAVAVARSTDSRFKCVAFRLPISSSAPHCQERSEPLSADQLLTVGCVARFIPKLADLKSAFTHLPRAGASSIAIQGPLGVAASARRRHHAAMP